MRVECCKKGKNQIQSKEEQGCHVFNVGPPAQPYDDSHMGQHSARHATRRRLKEEEEKRERRRRRRRRRRGTKRGRGRVAESR